MAVWAQSYQEQARAQAIAEEMNPITASGLRESEVRHIMEMKVKFWLRKKLQASGEYKPMRPNYRVGVAVLLLMLCAPFAYAQNPVNPKTWAFDQDPVDGYALTVNYEFGWFSSATAAAPVQVATVTKPGTCNPCAISTPLPSTPIAFQTWWAGVQAVGAGGARSGWSNLVPFEKKLSAPTNLRPQ